MCEHDTPLVIGGTHICVSYNEMLMMWDSGGRRHWSVRSCSRSKLGEVYLWEILRLVIALYRGWKLSHWLDLTYRLTRIIGGQLARRWGVVAGKVEKWVNGIILWGRYFMPARPSSHFSSGSLVFHLALDTFSHFSSTSAICFDSSVPIKMCIDGKCFQTGSRTIMSRNLNVIYSHVWVRVLDPKIS